jgi:hypothetical protein
LGRLLTEQKSVKERAAGLGASGRRTASVLEDDLQGALNKEEEERRQRKELKQGQSRGSSRSSSRMRMRAGLHHPIDVRGRGQGRYFVEPMAKGDD